jgi:hypothetical protein
MSRRSTSTSASVSDSDRASQTTTICRVQNDGRIQPGQDVLDDLGIGGRDRVALTLRDDPNTLGALDIDETIDLLDSLGAIEVDPERLDDVLSALAESGVVDREGPVTAAD